MICLRRKNVLVGKIILILFLIMLIWGGGYGLSYLRYNDCDITELEALRVQNRLLQEEINEVEGLREIQGEYLIGKVILRDIHEFYNEVVVNLGSDDGVRKGDAVLNSEGLVGVVYDIKSDKSYVKLLSGNYNVSVKIKDTYGNLNQGEINLIDKYTELSEGDEVYTSGYGEMSAGMYIGKIKNIGVDHENLGQVAKVQLIDNHNLNYVAILIQSK